MAAGDFSDDARDALAQVAVIRAGDQIEIVSETVTADNAELPAAIVFRLDFKLSLRAVGGESAIRFDLVQRVAVCLLLLLQRSRKSVNRGDREWV